MQHFSTLDLHTHLRGTLELSEIVALSAKNDVPVSSEVLNMFKNQSWQNFSEFLFVYHKISHVVKTSADWTYITYQHLKRVAADGTIYVELMVSPTNIISDDLSYKTLISSIQTGIELAFISYKVRAEIIVTCVRHKDPKDAILLAELVSENPMKNVRGFGLTGNENVHAPSEFKTAFEIAKIAGLKLTAHTGEWLSAESVISTVNQLNLDRVGHGIRVVENIEIMKELIERKIGFEVCLTSNSILGAATNLKQEPLKILTEHNALISLATDDPSFFNSTPYFEYLKASSLLNYEPRLFADKINSSAIKIAFCDQSTKTELYKICTEND